MDNAFYDQFNFYISQQRWQKTVCYAEYNVKHVLVLRDELAFNQFQ